jgi:hypothetical protein
MIPDNIAIIKVDSGKVVDWNTTIKLRSDTLDLLIKVAGPTPDDRFLFSFPEGVDFNIETWGWFINALEAHYRKPEDQRNIYFWFKDPKHAVYFKILWGGQ